MPTTNKQLGAWILTGFGLAVIGVAIYFNHTITALATGMDYGFGTVTRMYEIASADRRTVDYRVDVTVGTPLRAKLTVDITKALFRATADGSQIAVAWQRSNPSNNLAGEEIQPLVRGAVTESEFIEQQKQKGIFGIYAGAGLFGSGVLALILTRRKREKNSDSSALLGSAQN